MSDPPSPLIPLPFACDNTSQPITRELSHTLSKFLNNLIYNSTAPLSFETYPEDIYTIPFIREHQDSFLHYIDTHSLVEAPDEPPFSIPFTSPINHSDTLRKNIHPKIIYIPIANVFTTFLNNLHEKNILLPKHVFNLFSIQTLLQKDHFLIFLILNISAILKITLTTGLLLIFSKFIIFNTSFSKILLSIQVLKNKFRYTLFSLENSLDTITN